MQYYFKPNRRIPRSHASLCYTVLGCIVVAYIFILASIANGAPSYTNQTGDIVHNDMPMVTVQWDSADPFGFTALNYALYYADLFRTNGVTTGNISTTLTNYVPYSVFIGSTNALGGEIASNDTEILALQAADTVTANTIGNITNDVAQAQIDITNNTYIATLALTNPPSFSGVITNLSDSIYLWQENTNIVMDASGYRWLRNSSDATGYLCNAQSGIDTDLVGTSYYNLTSAVGGVTSYVELDDTFSSLLQYSSVSGYWVFTYGGSVLTLFDFGTAAQQSIALTSGVYTVNFERYTNLAYVTYTYIENFATSNELATSFAELEASLVAASLGASNYTDSVASGLSNNLQSQITANTEDITNLESEVDGIIESNLTDFAECFFSTNKTVKLWGNHTAMSNDYITVEGDWLVHYRVSPVVYWYLSATGTTDVVAYSNGVFKLTDTPAWPAPLYTSSTLEVYDTESAKWQVTVSSVPGFKETFAEGYPFDNTTNYIWRSAVPYTNSSFEAGDDYTFTPESVALTHLLGTDPGGVLVYWTSTTTVSEVSRAYVGALPADAVNLFGVQDGEGEWTLYAPE